MANCRWDADILREPETAWGMPAKRKKGKLIHKKRKGRIWPYLSFKIASENFFLYACPKDVAMRISINFSELYAEILSNNRYCSNLQECLKRLRPEQKHFCTFIIVQKGVCLWKRREKHSKEKCHEEKPEAIEKSPDRVTKEEGGTSLVCGKKHHFVNYVQAELQRL